MAIKNENGELLNGSGKWVPKKNIPKKDLKRDSIVSKLFSRAEKTESNIRTFKDTVLKEVNSWIEYLEEEAGISGATLKNTKGNICLTDLAGQKQIIVKINDMIEFDEGLNIAKTLIDECLSSWSEGANDNIKAIISEAFNVDKKGKVNTYMVLRLLKLKIRDKRWEKAMELIKESMNVAGSRRYVNFRVRKSRDDKWKSINLNFSTI